jgi:hypothetical protein
MSSMSSPRVPIEMPAFATTRSGAPCRSMYSPAARAIAAVSATSSGWIEQFAGTEAASWRRRSSRREQSPRALPALP